MADFAITSVQYSGGAQHEPLQRAKPAPGGRSGVESPTAPQGSEPDGNTANSPDAQGRSTGQSGSDHIERRGTGEQGEQLRRRNEQRGRGTHGAIPAPRSGGVDI